MFDSPRNVTKGVRSVLPSVLESFLWSLMDELCQSDHQLDYLQVFNLQEDKDSTGTPVQAIEHSQEEPEYKAIYNLYLPIKPVDCKIYIIDSGSYTTMLLAEEY